MLELLLKEEYEKAALQCALNLQALHQAALDGDWTIAWLLTQTPDPYEKRQWGGRCNEPPTRDSLREEHAGAQQELRPTEKEGHAKTRRGHRGRQAESQGERKRKGEEQRVERQREDRVMRGQAVPRNTDLFHAKPLELEPCLQKAFRSRGSFGRFLKLINQDKSPIDKNRVKGSGPRTPSYHEGCKSLFPSVLAIPNCPARVLDLVHADEAEWKHGNG